MSVRILRHSDIGKCPFLIFVPEHYREDGTCRCDDPEHTEMVEWGYVFRDGTWQAAPEASS